MQRLGHRMGDHHRRQPEFGDQPAGQIQDEFRGLGVKGGGMLVQQQHLGLAGYRHQQADRLALATRQQPDLVIEPVLQTKAETAKPFGRIGAHPAPDRQPEPARPGPGMGQREILENRQILAGAHLGVLKDPAQHPRPAVDRPLRHVLPADRHRAPHRPAQPGNDIERGRLAGPVRADDGQELPLRHAQADAAQGAGFQRRAGVEGDMDVVKPDHCRAPRVWPRG